MVFRNLSCLGIIICYINIIGIIPAYACNVLNVCDAFVQILQPLANVHETKWTRHVKRDCDVAVLIIAVVILEESFRSGYTALMLVCPLLGYYMWSLGDSTVASIHYGQRYEILYLIFNVFAMA